MYHNSASEGQETLRVPQGTALRALYRVGRTHNVAVTCDLSRESSAPCQPGHNLIPFAQALPPTLDFRALSACRFDGWLNRSQIVVRFQSTRKIAEQEAFFSHLLETCHLRPGVQSCCRRGVGRLFSLFLLFLDWARKDGC
jgi:hypothetical protein